MVKKAEGTDREFFWGTDFSTQGYMKWTLEGTGKDPHTFVLGSLCANFQQKKPN